MSKTKNVGGDASGYARTWQDGYGAGSKEAFAWCIRKTMELEQKASSDEGKKATKFMVEMMTKELHKRYPPPPPKDGDSAPPSQT